MTRLIRWHIWPKIKHWIPFALTIFLYVLGGLYLIYWDEVEVHIPCLFKWMTGIPCPGCGMSQAFVKIIHGNIIGAVYDNLLSIPLFIWFMIMPIWLYIDAYKHQTTLLQCLTYTWPLKYIIICACFILMSWLWNLYKQMYL